MSRFHPARFLYQAQATNLVQQTSFHLALGTPMSATKSSA